MSAAHLDVDSVLLSGPDTEMDQRHMGTQPADNLQLLGALLTGRMRPGEVALDDWPSIVALASREGLALCLYWIVKQADATLAASPMLAPVSAPWRYAAAHALLQEAARNRVNAALVDAGIPAIWLKGMALAHTVYPRPWTRPMGDLDVLVPFQDREHALEQAASLGYGLYFSEEGALEVVDKAFAEQMMHHYHLHGEAGTMIVLEIHWHLLSGGEHKLSATGHAWFRSQTRVLDGKPPWMVFRPEAQILHLCAHAMIHHGESLSSLRQFFDLDRVIVAAPIDWDLVIARAVDFGWTYAVGRALRRAKEVFGTAVPEAVFSELEARRPDYEDTYRVVLRSGPGARWDKMQDYLTRLPPHKRLWTILRTAMPPRAYMRHRYRIADRQPIWPFYVRRWGDQAGAILAWLNNRYLRHRGR